MHTKNEPKGTESTGLSLRKETVKQLNLRTTLKAGDCSYASYTCITGTRTIFGPPRM